MISPLVIILTDEYIVALVISTRQRCRLTRNSAQIRACARNISFVRGERNCAEWDSVCGIFRGIDFFGTESCAETIIYVNFAPNLHKILEILI